ncbi:MAG: hypothetical protein R3B37_06425 [Nitrospira sp.]|nr:hypothetical protein [Nitrospira sp.]
MAQQFGRPLFFGLILMWVRSLITLRVTCLAPHIFAEVLLLFPLLGFFTNSLFSNFPIFSPDLHPTRFRATGAGFCFNASDTLVSAVLLATEANRLSILLS